MLAQPEIKFTLADGRVFEAVRTLFDTEVLSDGTSAYSYKGDKIYLVKDDVYAYGAARYHPKLNCPPCVQTGYSAENETSGDVQTPMIPYRWDEYLKKLNGYKWEAAVAPNLAMFNTRETDDNGDDLPWEKRDNMSSQLFGGGCLVRAKPAPRKPGAWAQLILLDYEAGPPPGMPTFWENPLFVQRFTAICRQGGLILHVNDFFYPVVAKRTVYIRWFMLERFTNNLVSRYLNEPREQYNYSAYYGN